MIPITDETVGALAQELRNHNNAESWRAANPLWDGRFPHLVPFDDFARWALEWMRRRQAETTPDPFVVVGGGAEPRRVVEWGWSHPDGAPITIHLGEAEARRFAGAYGGQVYLRTVGPWRPVPHNRDRAAALRREAVELMSGPRPMNERDEPVARLLDRADALDGGGS